jgi:glucose-1-phosphate cytidylyltransferase
MKVVLFCGGLGTRLVEYSNTVPKPMVPIGYRPILWHLMRYYAHFGHRQFILCLGYRGDLIKEYFLNYDECVSNNFTLSVRDRRVELHASDVQDWEITFIDTGLHANVGQRLKAVQSHLQGEDVFLANYADGLSDIQLPRYVDSFRRHDQIASFACVKPSQSFHVVSINGDDTVEAIGPARGADLWINGGFFILRHEIFDYLRGDDDLVEGAFQRLLARSQLLAYRHHGFWACMDTYKEQQQLESLFAAGDPPWAVWSRSKTQGDQIPGPRLVRDALFPKSEELVNSASLFALREHRGGR